LLNRRSGIHAREGVTIDRSVMASWVGHMAALPEPLAQRIARHARQRKNYPPTVRYFKSKDTLNELFRIFLC
jgi:hypothetical protein